MLHHAEMQWIKESVYLTYLHQEHAPSGWDTVNQGERLSDLPLPTACSVMLRHSESRSVFIWPTSTKRVLHHKVNQGRCLSDQHPHPQEHACSIMLRHSESRRAFIWPTSTKSLLRHAEKVVIDLAYLHQKRAPSQRLSDLPPSRACSVTLRHRESRWAFIWPTSTSTKSVLRHTETVNQGRRLSDLLPPRACSIMLRHSESRWAFIWPTSTKSVLRHAETQWIKAGVYLTYLHQERAPSCWDTVNQGRRLSDLPPPRACSVTLTHSESRRAFIWPTSTKSMFRHAETQWIKAGIYLGVCGLFRPRLLHGLGQRQLGWTKGCWLRSRHRLLGLQNRRYKNN